MPAEANQTEHQWSGRQMAVSFAGVATVVVLVAFTAYTERSSLSGAGHLLAHVPPVCLVTTAGFSVGALAALWLTHVFAQRALGLRPPPSSLIRTVLSANLLNLVTKSNGLAGLVAFQRHGHQAGAENGNVTAAYLLAAAAQQIGFSIVLIVVFAQILLQGALKPSLMLAGVAFLVYALSNLILYSTAFRSQESIRGMFRRVKHLLPWPRFDPADDRAADELFEALGIVRATPLVALRPVIPAVVADLALAATLAAALRAVGADVPLSVALLAFGASGLAGIVGLLPGGLGFVELSGVTVLVASGVPASKATAAIALYRLAELWLPILLGLAASAGVTAEWRRPIRLSAAALALAGATLSMISAANDGESPLRTVRGFAVGLFETHHFVATLCASLLLSVTPALWRGKRWAALAALPIFTVAPFAAPAGRTATILTGIAFLAVITAGWKAFDVRSDPRRIRAGLGWFLVAESGLIILSTVLLYVLDANFRESTSLVRSFWETLRLCVLLPSHIEPVTAHGVMVIESVRLTSATLAAILLATIMVPLLARRSDDRNAATSLVERWGTNSLAHFTLWDDKAWVLVDHGGVSYHTVGHVALALGGPIGSPNGRRAAVRRFVSECDSYGWIPAFHQVGPEDEAVLVDAGFRLQYIGAEARIDVRRFTLEGHHWKGIRSTLRHLERLGYTVTELSQPLDDATVDELADVSDAWLLAGGHRERTFTLGQFSPDYVRSTRVVAARDADGRIEAFVNLLPTYASNVGSFDMMRRRPDSANGVMDLLFVAIIDLFAAEGLRYMSLGMAPLALLPGHGVVDRALLQLRHHGDHWFNFEGLQAFKEKWQPEWEPRYVAYRSAADLPPVLASVRAAGEVPEEGPRIRDRVRRMVATLSGDVHVDPAPSKSRYNRS